MNDQIPTPRTDALKFKLCFNFKNLGDRVYELVFAKDFAKLELELNKAKDWHDSTVELLQLYGWQDGQSLQMFLHKAVENSRKQADEILTLQTQLHQWREVAEKLADCIHIHPINLNDDGRSCLCSSCEAKRAFNQLKEQEQSK